MDSINATAALGGLSILIWLVIAVVASVFLFMAYGRTKMSGFLWLFGAVVVWPTATRVLSFVIAASTPTIMGERGLTAHSMATVYQTISLAETLVGGILLIVAVIVLNNEASRRLAVQPAATAAYNYPAPPPPYTSSDASIRQ